MAPQAVAGTVQRGNPTLKPSDSKTPMHVLWRRIVRTLTGSPKAFTSRADVVYSKLPRDIGAEITNICNADCSFCGYGKGPDGKASDARKKGKLELKAFRHLLRLYSEAGGGHFSLSPILGEITAHPNWMELVREARDTPNVTGVSCFTNAILLDRFGYENILTSGLTAMSISTSLGSEEQYKRLYGVDKYDIVVKNVLGILRANAKLGHPVSISLLLRIDKPYKPFLESSLYREISEVLAARQIVILSDFWDDFHGVIKEDGLPAGHNFKNRDTDKTQPCYAMFRKLQIMTDGKIQACACRVEPELWAGNILDYETLEEAWRNPGLERLRDNWFEGNIPSCCKTCSHYMPYTTLSDGSRPLAVAQQFSRRVAAKLGITRSPTVEEGQIYD